LRCRRAEAAVFAAQGGLSCRSRDGDDGHEIRRWAFALAPLVDAADDEFPEAATGALERPAAPKGDERGTPRERVSSGGALFMRTFVG